MRRGLAAVAAFLLVMAWQYRKNKAVLFVIIATLFVPAAALSTRWENTSDWPPRVFALCWLTCMVIAGALAIKNLVLAKSKEKRDKAVPTHSSRTHKT
jgi:CHASE2 domain-containing sensor protein